MNKSRLLFLLVSLAVMLPVVSGALGRAAGGDRESEDSLSKQLAVFSEVLSLIQRAYVEETSIDDLLRGALNGSTDALDPLATFVPAAELGTFEEARRIGTRHSGVTVAKDRGIAFVVAVQADSPGSEAGLQQGDILAKIDNRSTRTMPLWRLQSILAGPPGTNLQLEVLRRGQTRDLDLTLAAFESPPPVLRDARGQHLLRLSRFETGDLPVVREILAQLASQQAGKLLIDVRGVAGGDAEAAYSVAGLFVDGRLGELRGRDEAEIHFQATERPVWQGESVILTDSGTQGAAEIFVTVLRQLTASRVVGRRSFGHAGRQRLMALSDGSRLLLTDAFYRGPDGEPIDQGLVPDVTVNESGRRLGEADDPGEDETLERGLEVLLAPVDETAREVA